MVRIDFNRLRFLVIDDNAHMRRILRTLLHGFGTREVYEAEDGAAGLEAYTHSWQHCDSRMQYPSYGSGFWWWESGTVT